MAITEIKDLSALVRNGMYDTSRTSDGASYYVANGQGEIIPNPLLVRNHRVRVAGDYFISNGTNFPNGPIWSINIHPDFCTTEYPEGTLFPNPARQNFSSEVTLGRQVRRFFDAAVTLIESGRYRPGPNHTLVPVDGNDR